MSDFNTPTLTTSYTSVLSDLKDRDVDALTLQKDAVSNSPNGAIKVVGVGGSRPSANNIKIQEYDVSSYEDRLLDVTGGGTGAATASSARTNLGLGTISTQNSNAVTITGGTAALTSVSGDGSGLTNLTPGNLSSPVAIETTADSYGQPIVTWRDAYETWAGVQALSGREFFASNQIKSQTMKRYVVTYSTVIEPTWRIVDDGKAWNIESVLDSGEVTFSADFKRGGSGTEKSELHLLCSRVTT